MKNQKALFGLFRNATGKKEYVPPVVKDVQMPYQVSRVNEYRMRD